MPQWTWLVSMLLASNVVITVTAQTPVQSFSNAEVIAMVKAGLSSDTIELAIHKAAPAPAFDVTPGALIQLKAAGVPDRIIQLMLGGAGGGDRPPMTPPDLGASGLRGVAVQDRTIATEEWVRTIGKVPPKRPSVRRVVTVTSLPDGVPAKAAGLRVGDIIFLVDIPGAAQRPYWDFTSSDFARNSTLCSPDCMLGVARPNAARVASGSVWLSNTSSMHVGPQVNYQAEPLGGDSSLGCTWTDMKAKPGIQMAAPCVAGEAVVQTQAPSSSPIQDEIAEIRNGRNAPMPPAQAIAANLGGQTGMVVENGTSYTLSVLLSGPMSQRIQVAPGASQTVTLSPGNYEIAASVSGTNVTPFYGKQAFGANTQYSEKFYIK